MSLKAVFFDVGYTLVDETRQWREWAAWMNVPSEKVFATLREVISRREHHSHVFEVLKPGFDREIERAARVAAGRPDAFTAADLYPDALNCLSELKRDGYLIGLAGNQPEAAEAALRAMHMPADAIASSAQWKVEKPAPEFFRRIVEAARCTPGEIAYVGDRIDNDVVPAHACGMVSIFLRRGPWAEVQTTWPEAELAHATIDSLDDLSNALKKFVV